MQFAIVSDIMGLRHSCGSAYYLSVFKGVTVRVEW